MNPLWLLLIVPALGVAVTYLYYLSGWSRRFY